MERDYSSDQVDGGIGHFLALSSAALAAACEWILEADRGQRFLADGRAIFRSGFRLGLV